MVEIEYQTHQFHRPPRCLQALEVERPHAVEMELIEGLAMVVKRGRAGAPEETTVTVESARQPN
jgi:hypothetical protein